jgi:hypothetical protein
MTLSELAEVIEPLIPNGKPNAIKGRDLRAAVQSVIGMRVGERRVRKAIELHRPWICSTSSHRNPGYYKAATTAERFEAADYCTSYIGSLAHRRKAIMEHYAQDFAGRQAELFQEVGA